MVGADTDAADHDATDGMLTIAAGALEATLAITVHDDAHIEPAREWFTLTLQPSAVQPPPWGLGTAVAQVAVAEGVCDRPRQVRNALQRPERRLSLLPRTDPAGAAATGAVQAAPAGAAEPAGAGSRQRR